ncbi:MAG TPA: CRISPR-associated endonuclease Cas1 [Acidobacteriota bacterium]|nr:CRISPR-associated endonuclease Cas1 [Acidobacteriota bacterium]
MQTESQQRLELPDYLPARMVNEFVYCPRLFFYEWVEGIFRESTDTVEGTVQHQRVDRDPTVLPEASAITDEMIHSRSVTLSSDRHRVIARMDLIEVSARSVTPVDYKHGQPRKTEEGLELWPTDRVQLAIQGLILRENGYRCEEGLVYYAKTKQRVRVPFDEDLMTETIQLVEQAWALAAEGRIPPPLADSPKCPGCSMVGICLPDETNVLGKGVATSPFQWSLFNMDRDQASKASNREVRRLITPRSDRRPLYLNTQGVRVGKSGGVLQVRDRDQKKVILEIRIGEICQLNLLGNIQLSTQAIHALCQAEVPICYFSQGGWFYGITMGMNTKNVFLRRAQFRLAEQDWFVLSLSRRLISGKIRNQRTMLQRNHIEPSPKVLLDLKRLANRAEEARTLEELLGVEGSAARLYFGEFGGMIKVGEDEQVSQQFRFDFSSRNRRPPRDAVNALLSLGYSLLGKDFTIACYAVGFDPFMGYFHQPRFGRPSLALDLMEPFRPLVADSAVLTAVNTRMVTPRHFIQTGPAVALTPQGRKSFFHAYELRMDNLVTHPLFDYRVSYRRLLEIQARLLARVLEGELGAYPVFVTR